jgi:uncharacterized phage-associated protein
MYQQHYREKLLQAIVYFARHTQKLGITKLMKLLYYLDFIHFRQTGTPVTGLDYYAWERGPVPRDVWQELSDPDRLPADVKQVIRVDRIPMQRGGEFLKISPRVSFDSTFFTPREVRLLGELAEIFAEANADDMVEASHLRNQPWHKTIKERGMGEHIDYMLAVDGSQDALPPDVILERLEEMAEMQQWLAHA